jgi:phage gp16-like protein
MVQLTAAAVAAAILAVPAIAGPIPGSYLQSRSTESNDALEARMFKAMIDAAAHGPARSMITKPIKDQAKEAAKGNSVHQPHQQTLSQKVYEQTHKGGSSSGSKQGKRDLEDLETRMFKAMIDAAAHGPARSMITKPIKDQAKEAAKGNSVHRPHQQTLSQKVYEQTRQSNNNKGGSSGSGSKQGKRDLELEFEERDFEDDVLESRMFKAMIDAAAHGPARSMITKPIKDQGKEAAKGNSVRQTHQQTLSQKVYEQTNNKGGSSKQGKRDLEELETRMFKAMIDAAAHGPARSMITKPIKDQGKEAAKGNSVRQTHQQTLSQKVYEQTNNKGGSSSSKQGKRDLDDELEARWIYEDLDELD